MSCEHKEVKRVSNPTGGVATKVCADCGLQLPDEVETT